MPFSLGTPHGKEPSLHGAVSMALHIKEDIAALITLPAEIRHALMTALHYVTDLPIEEMVVSDEELIHSIRDHREEMTAMLAELRAEAAY